MGTEAPGTGAKPTILEAAVAMGVTLLTAEEADKQIIGLLQQVGDLECAVAAQQAAIEILKTQKAALEIRNARLEDGIKAISVQCAWRTTKVCDVDCGGRAFCDVEGLNPVCLENHAGAAQAS